MKSILSIDCCKKKCLNASTSLEDTLFNENVVLKSLFEVSNMSIDEKHTYILKYLNSCWNGEINDKTKNPILKLKCGAGVFQKQNI